MQFVVIIYLGHPFLLFPGECFKAIWMQVMSGGRARMNETEIFRPITSSEEV